jgi:hypothetical protein
VDRTACELVKQDHEKKQRERNELMSKMFDWGHAQEPGRTDGGSAVRVQGADVIQHRVIPISPATFEALLRIALPPLNLVLRERYLTVRRLDPDAAAVAAEELAIVARIRVRLVRQVVDLNLNG